MSLLAGSHLHGTCHQQLHTLQALQGSEENSIDMSICICSINSSHFHFSLCLCLTRPEPSCLLIPTHLDISQASPTYKALKANSCFPHIPLNLLCPPVFILKIRDVVHSIPQIKNLVTILDSLISDLTAKLLANLLGPSIKTDSKEIQHCKETVLR